MREKVIVNEVGLRDGLQNQPHPVTTADKAQLAQLLVAAGVRHIEATSFVSPKAVPQMADAAELSALLPQRADLHYTALVPNLKGYEAAKAAGYPTVALVLSTTDTFNQKNLRMSLQQAIDSCRAIIQQAKQDGVKTRAYIAGAFACPYEAETPVAVTQELTHQMLAAGADEIAIADTIGAGHPAQMKAIFKELLAQYGAERFFVHLHDTRGLAAALAWTACDLGIRKFDASVGGLGGCPFAPGATGNVATEDLVYLLEASGLDTGIDLLALREAVRFAEQAIQGPAGGRIYRWVDSQEKRGVTVSLPA